MLGCKVPDQAPLELNHSAQGLLEVTHAAINASRSRLALIVAKEPTDRTFDNFIVPLAEDENDRLLQSSIVEIYHYVSRDKAIRDSSRAAMQLWNEYSHEVNTRWDVFQGIDTIHTRCKDGTVALKPEEKHYLNRLHATYRQNAVHLFNDSEKAQYHMLQKRIDHLCAECIRNLQEEAEGLWFTDTDLKGVPEGYMRGLKRDASNKLFVGLKKNDIHVILNFATEGETRERLFIAADNKCSANVRLVDELVRCRAKAASLLGYGSYAEYTIQGRMLDISQVRELLESVQEQVINQAAAERTVLMETKRQYLISEGKATHEIDCRIHLWDLNFYIRLTKESKYNVDEKFISEYFSLHPTLAGLLQICERLFGLRFHKFSQPAWVWDDDVIIFAAWNEEAMGGEFLGYIYFDLFGRPGKYNNNCMITFAPGFITNGKLSHPSVALVASFPSATPTLLQHHQIVTLFHELEHTIHYLVGRTQFARTYGTGTAHDFVEIPSKMLERWCWTPSILHSLATHYTHHSKEDQDKYLSLYGKVPNEKPPIELFDRLVASQAVNQACQIQSQLHLARFDLAVHDNGTESDLSRLFNRLRKECTSLVGPESHGRGLDWGSGQARFQHIFQGYAAGYYCYTL